MILKLCSVMKERDNSRGFTLVELIVVMAILALLASLAVPKFGSVLSDSKTTAHEANLRLIEQAAELYWAKTSTPQAQSTIADDTHYLVTNRYLKEAPVNPLTETNNYRVTIAADGKITVDVP